MEKIKAYRLKFEDGTTKTVFEKNSLEVVKKYDLATRQHINTRIVELQGEQEAIALASLQEYHDNARFLDCATLGGLLRNYGHCRICGYSEYQSTTK